MMRKTSIVMLVAGVLMLAFAELPRGASPIRLARQPDYHAGRVVFSYLGDIWTASETGADPDRITDHRGHDMYSAILARRQVDRVCVQPLRQQRRLRRPVDRRRGDSG